MVSHCPSSWLGCFQPSFLAAHPPNPTASSKTSVIPSQGSKQHDFLVDLAPECSFKKLNDQLAPECSLKKLNELICAMKLFEQADCI